MINNYLSNGGFDVTIPRLPNVEFFVQKMVLPSIDANPVERSTPLSSVYDVSDRLRYNDFDLTFIIDENMRNYIEIFNWMKGINSPETLNQYAALEDSKDGITSDITVLLLNSHKNPHIRITMINAFPVGLTSVDLNLVNQDVTYAEASVTFRYDRFLIEQL